MLVEYTRFFKLIYSYYNIYVGAFEYQTSLAIKHYKPLSSKFPVPL